MTGERPMFSHWNIGAHRILAFFFHIFKLLRCQFIFLSVALIYPKCPNSQNTAGVSVIAFAFIGDSSVDLELPIWEKGISNVGSAVRLAVWDVSGTLFKFPGTKLDSAKPFRYKVFFAAGVF